MPAPAKWINLYTTLGVRRTSTESEVRAAYRKRALETHPDKGGDHESFLNLINAFEVLSDPSARKKYDGWLEKRGDRDGLQVRKRPAPEMPEDRRPPATRAEPQPPPAPAPEPSQEARAKAHQQSKGSSRWAKHAMPELPEETERAHAEWQRMMEVGEEDWVAIAKESSWRFLSRVILQGKEYISRHRWREKLTKPAKQRTRMSWKPSRMAGRKVGLESLLDASNQANLGEKDRQRLQKHIRKVSAQSFCLMMCFDWLEVASSSTNLAEAIDWHIILMKLL